jgi:hypothetical protein
MAGILGKWTTGGGWMQSRDLAMSALNCCGRGRSTGIVITVRKLDATGQNPETMRSRSIPLLLLLVLCATRAVAQEPQRGTDVPQPWIQLTDSVGRLIGLREDQQAGWKALHAKWDDQAGQAAQGESHQGHAIKLHSAREFDLRAFLTGGQYDRWRVLNRRAPRLEDKNPPGTNMPRDR